MKKNSEIPTNPDEDFTLIPYDCNSPTFTIELSPLDGSVEQNKLKLFEVYEFKE